MPIITTYKCDKCGSESHSADDYFSIGVFWSVYPRGINAYDVQGKPNKIWCRDCMGEAGLVSLRSKTKVVTPPAPPNLEDLIRELVQDEILASKNG